MGDSAVRVRQALPSGKSSTTPVLWLLCATAIMVCVGTVHAQYTADYQTNIISGVTSNWSGDYIVGSNLDSDVLFIQNSGILSNGNGSVGGETGASDNTAMVSGNGSTWNNSGNLGIGYGGHDANDQLIITNGGTVYDNYGTIGLETTGDVGSGGGSVLVTGTGSAWSNRNDLSIDGGELTISNGGAVFNNNGIIGYENDVLVTGTGSIWSVSGSLSIDQDAGLIVSNSGFVQSATVQTYGRALVTGTGSVWSIGADLDIGDGPNLTIADGGVVNVSGSVVFRLFGSMMISGGGLYVTNGLGTISISDSDDTLNLNGGTVTADELSVNDFSTFTFTSGLLTSGGTYVTNGQSFAVGDGTDGAVFEVVGGFHSFANGLTISSNAVLSGCGTIDGSVVVNPGGTVLANCGGTLTFTDIVTNNGMMQTIGGTTLEAYGLVVNNGVIDAINGATNFHGGFINNGTVLTASSVQISRINRSGQDIVIEIPSVTNHTYQLQYTASFIAANWTNTGASQPGGNGITLTFTDSGGATNSPTRLYRVGCSI
jgi:T5SS/PEP-CTERM-associated repeat protein